MQAYDLIMLIVLGMATLFGAIKGFAWQVASLASILVSYFVAYRFRFDVAEMIHAKPPWNQFLAMLLLYVGTSFVIWVAFRLLSGAIDRVRLKEFDRHLGAGFGFAKGLIYCLLITMFAMSLLGPNQQAAICQSRSGYYIATALDRGVGVLPREIHDVVGPYLARLDSKLKDGQQHEETTEGDGGSIWPGGFNSLPTIPGGLTEALPNLQLPNLSPSAGQNPPGNQSGRSEPKPGGFHSVLPPTTGQPIGGMFPPQNFPPLDSASGSSQLGAPTGTHSGSSLIGTPSNNPQIGAPSGLQPIAPSSGTLRPVQTNQQARQPAYVLPR